MRIVSAVVLAPLVLVCIWLGGVPFQVLITVAAAGMAVEWAALSGWRVRDPPALVLIGTIVAAVVAAGEDSGLLGLAILLMGGLALIGLGIPGRRFRLVVGLGYIGLGAMALGWVRGDPEAGWPNLLFLLLLVWASDIGAYTVGRALGGPRLAPRISPKKTWSGAVGGLLIAVGVGMVAAFVMQPPTSVLRIVVLTAGLGIVAQAGDLFESAFKRHMGAKDSGHLIPGHGGLLDRLDALLAVAPFAALLVLASGRGVVLWE
jgi:phosphatidate cytidylyltransferase